MEKVLITGATSYLGQVLSRKHLERGDDVYVLVRPTTNTEKLATGISSHNILVDDGDQEALCRMMANCQPDLLHHLASFYVREPDTTQVAPLMEASLTFGTRLIEALDKAGPLPRMVNATSHSIFYDSVSERPLNQYAATKLAFETILNYYADAQGLAYCSLVLFDTYGPDDTRVKLMMAIAKALQEGQTLSLTDEDIALELVHIEDAARAFIVAGDLLKEDKAIAGKRYAITKGEHILTSDLVVLFEELSGKAITKDWGAFPLPKRKIRVPWRGTTLPNWEAQITLREGVKEMLKAAG
jgi:nucleoside-diphosphate-sugar epimerase